MKRIWKNIILIGFAMALCILATGCMGGQKDISKSDEEKYEAIVAEACEEYGYTYEKQKVLPLGAELLYHVYCDDETVLLTVNIDEESTTDRVSCDFEVIRGGATEDSTGAGLDQYLNVPVKIAEYFTDEITKDKLITFLNNNENWGAPEEEDEDILKYKSKDNMDYKVYVATVVEGQEMLEECLHFGWDNGKVYSLKKDKDK